jgi:sensor c-di-GMP phosphodiesterase-like protein
VQAAALAKLIQSSNVGVIAEGVETADQVEVLRQCGIGMAQGWLFSHPLRASAFSSYFSEHRYGSGPAVVGPSIEH